MRHVPTALFIDTEAFVRNGFRLHTKGFLLLTTTFVKGGIRLLIPSMMERELRRHLERHARECGQSWAKLQDRHPVNLLKSWTGRTAEDFAAECLAQMNGQWDQFKSHFTVESLPLVGDLESIVDQYFTVAAPFSTGGKSKEFPDAFMLSALALYHQKNKVTIAVVSGDGDFKKACALLPYVWYFESIDDYVNAFKPEQSPEVEEPIDPLRPIVTEDLSELKGILQRGSHVTTLEADRLISLLQNRGENYRYFFLNATDPFWIPRLTAAGFFTTLPEVEQMPDGTSKIPDWAPIYYLEKAFDADPEAVVGILESLPSTTNPRILEGVVSIAAKCDNPEFVSRLAPKILSAAETPRWGREKFISLLEKLAKW
jgi:hypothetical protein